MGTKITVRNQGKIGKANITEKGDIINNPYKSDKSNKQGNPWISGSFYLFLFVIIITSIVVAGKLLPVYSLPIIIIGSMLLFSIIGAFQLRNDTKLGEKNFIQLMALSFKNIPFLTKK